MEEAEICVGWKQWGRGESISIWIHEVAVAPLDVLRQAGPSKDFATSLLYIFHSTALVLKKPWGFVN